MLKARLERQPSTDQGTFGRLYFGRDAVFTVELPWRDNRRQMSCVPLGRYTCRLVNSPRFGRVYGLRDVPGRSHVLLHSANFGGDSSMGYTTQLQGCIAPCLHLGAMRNTEGKMQRAGLVSRPALRKLMLWANNQDFELEIVCLPS